MKILPPELTQTLGGRNFIAGLLAVVWLYVGFMPMINASSTLLNAGALLSGLVGAFLYYHFVFVPLKRRDNNG